MMAAARYSTVVKPWLNFPASSIFCTSACGMGWPVFTSRAKRLSTSGVESQETRGLLAAAIGSLSDREKIVVTLYYFEGLTLAEIGEILGVTESRVCQIHTKAVGSLRGQLAEVD